jgi:hypothetical protein
MPERRAFVLPLVAMAAHRLFCCDTPRRALLGVVTVALVVGQVRVLDHAAELAEPGKRSDRGAMLATAALARDGRRFIYQSPLHPFEPQVTVDEIVAMDRDGKLPPRSDATVRDRLTVLARLDLALQRDAVVAAAPGSTVALGPLRHATATPAPSGPSGPGCVQITARSGNEVTLRPSGPAAVGLSGDGLVRIWLRDEDRGTDGEAVVGVLTPGAPQVLSIGGIEGSVVLSLPEGPGTVVCGVG